MDALSISTDNTAFLLSSFPARTSSPTAFDPSSNTNLTFSQYFRVSTLKNASMEVAAKEPLTDFSRSPTPPPTFPHPDTVCSPSAKAPIPRAFTEEEHAFPKNHGMDEWSYVGVDVFGSYASSPRTIEKVPSHPFMEE
eukprot:TRINITY_DN10791_c0_g1_i1.p1 TRINITY_DN10791_c0_g1~~TRINITY_DN10791_c0_g1_i1.p1  ORF type:complete len:138 (+),score=7.27 TRINITY_DN10791_c0_g1_i1:109-522(+)